MNNWIEVLGFLQGKEGLINLKCECDTHCTYAIIVEIGLSVFSWQLLVVCETRLLHSYFAVAYLKC